MRRGQAHRNQQIGALGFPRNDRAVGNQVRAARGNLNVPFILDRPLRRDVALDIVGVHVVRAHADRILHNAHTTAIELGHNVVRHHTACFAHVDRVRPMVVVDEFVLGQSPLGHFLANLFRNAGVMRERPHQALLIQAVLPQDGLALLVTRLRIVVIHPDVVGRKSPHVVRVGLAVGHPSDAQRQPKVPRLEIPQQQLVLPLVITFRLAERNAVFRNPRHAHPIAVGLKPPIAGSTLSRIAAVNARQQAAGGVTGNDIWVDRNHKAMVVDVPLLLYAVECLAVLVIRLATDRVGYAGGRHQISFVCGVDKVVADEERPILHSNRHDAAVPHGGPRSPIQFGLTHDAHPIGHLTQHRFENRFGHARLEGPHRIVVGTVSPKLGRILMLPRLPAVVVCLDPLVELASHTADHRLVPRVGIPQTCRRQASQVASRFNQDDRLAHPSRLHSRHHACRSSSVDDEIGAVRLGSEDETAPPCHDEANHWRSPTSKWSLSHR